MWRFQSWTSHTHVSVFLKGEEGGGGKRNAEHLCRNTISRPLTAITLGNCCMLYSQTQCSVKTQRCSLSSVPRSRSAPKYPWLLQLWSKRLNLFQNWNSIERFKNENVPRTARLLRKQNYYPDVPFIININRNVIEKMLRLFYLC